MLRPFMSYYGGKFRIAKHYPKPVYKTIIEPFAGSAGYGVNYPNNQVILYEINPKIFGVWDYLIKVKEEEIRSLPVDITDLREMNLTQEQRWLIGMWVNTGTSSPNNMRSARSLELLKGGNCNTWCQPLKAVIANQLKFIRHWKVYNKSYEECPNQKATWFIDPPYQGPAGRCYPFHDIDYPELGEWCRARKGQVIVCEGEGANWLPFRKFMDARNTTNKRKKNKVSREVVWTKCDKAVGFGLNVC
jgi:site-specific DNA-adenine methylase